MKSKAAVLTGVNQPWEILDVDVRDPRDNEILIRYVAAGLCHSDMHLMTGDLPAELPYIGGHEGAGIVEAVGPGVSRVKVGDHVVCAFIPSCGHCRWCASGQQSICDLGATILEGCLPDGSFPFSLDGKSLGAMCMLGTFSPVRHDLRDLGRQDRRRSAARGRRAVRLRRADRLRLGGQHRQHPGRRHDHRLRRRRDRLQRRAGRRPGRGDERDRRRPAGVQARVRPGDGRHPLRQRRRRGDRAGPGTDRRASAPTPRSSPSTSSTRVSSSRPHRRSARAARSCSPASRIPRRSPSTGREPT